MKPLIAICVLIACLFATEAQACCGLPGRPVRRVGAALVRVVRVRPVRALLRARPIRNIRPGILIPKR